MPHLTGTMPASSAAIKVIFTVIFTFTAKVYDIGRNLSVQTITEAPLVLFSFLEISSKHLQSPSVIAR